jgi:hypothetical protein
MQSCSWSGRHATPPFFKSVCGRDHVEIANRQRKGLQIINILAYVPVDGTWGWGDDRVRDLL